jgi:pimeloyl-ACP methyl ester carboxylesterase
MKRINMLTDSRIAALYTDVPADDRENFRAFLEAFPYHFVTLDGMDWAYLLGESQGEDLLILSGALCAPEVSWGTISALAQKHRIIAPEYPPVRSMDALVDGIAAILRKEGIPGVHVMGGSYGGFVTQVFVRRYPELTRSLLLSHTLPPDPESAVQVEKMLRWLKFIPERGLRWLMGKRLGKLMPEKTPEMALMYATFQEMLYYRLTKADLLALLWRTADYTRREFTSVDLVDWPGKVLLILADDDPATPEDVRVRLQVLYPQASMRLFHGSGHVTAVEQKDEYLAAIENFLQEQ